MVGSTLVLGDVTEFRRLDEMKNGLAVAGGSDELKTPLTSMRMILPLLIEGKVGPPLPDRQSELLVAVREGTPSGCTGSSKTCWTWAGSSPAAAWWTCGRSRQASWSSA